MCCVGQALPQQDAAVDPGVAHSQPSVFGPVDALQSRYPAVH
jgi:hypothetical protein